MQTPDKKKQMFLDMQEHPEKYSEEQIETMMDDLDRLPDVDVAWQEFQQTGQSSPRRWLKAAASIIGVLMLSGIAYAAVHIISRNAGVDEETPTHEVQNINSPLNDDAHYYNKVADIQSKEAHELRLYYKWDPKDALENVVDDLNHFDHVNLAIEDDKLIVKP